MKSSISGLLKNKKLVDEVEIRDQVNQFLKKVEIKRSKNTYLQYKNSMDAFLEYLERNEIEILNDETIEGFKKSLLDEVETFKSDKAYKDFLKSEKEKKKANKDYRKRARPIRKISTVNIRIKALNLFLDSIGKSDLKLEPLKENTSNINIKALDFKEYARFLEWCDNLGQTKQQPERMRLLTETLALTGIRIGELKFIRVKDLTPKKRIIEVTNKNKTRYIFIPKNLAKRLRAYAKKYNIPKDAILFHGTKVNPDTGKREPDYDAPLDSAFIRREMKRIAGKARGIPLEKIFLHNFRHFFSALFSEVPETIGAYLPFILGHSGAKVTDTYTKTNDSKLKDQVDLMERYYDQKLKDWKKSRNSSKTRANKRQKI